MLRSDRLNAACLAVACEAVRAIDKARLRPAGFGEAAFACFAPIGWNAACLAVACEAVRAIDKARLRPAGFGEAAFACFAPIGWNAACLAVACEAVRAIDKARLRPAGFGEAASACFAPIGWNAACLAVACEASEGWWSQAGSNRRPRHCERRALPTELWPLRYRLDRFEKRPAIAAIYNPCECQVKNAESAVFRDILPGTSLV